MKHPVRIVLMLAIVAMLTFVSAGTALAKAPQSELEVKGIISTIDKSASPSTLTITLKDNSSITLKITSSTMITKAGLGKAIIDDLVQDDRAIVIYDKDTLVATRIVVSRPIVKHHSFVGTIKTISSASFVITTKKQGDVTIVVNAETKYKVPGVKNATLASFKVEDKIAVLAVEVSGGNLALHVNLIPGRPIFIQRVGTIEAYQQGTSITLKDKKGELSVFTINSNTKILFKKGATEVKIGEQATVIASRDPGTDQFTAKDILVFTSQQPKPGK